MAGPLVGPLHPGEMARPLVGPLHPGEMGGRIPLPHLPHPHPHPAGFRYWDVVLLDNLAFLSPIPGLMNLKIKDEIHKLIVYRKFGSPSWSQRRSPSMDVMAEQGHMTALKKSKYFIHTFTTYLYVPTFSSDISKSPSSNSFPSLKNRLVDCDGIPLMKRISF